MRVFMRIYDHPDVNVWCKKLEVREGVKMIIDDEPCQMLVAQTDDDGLYHPVIDLEVM